MTKKKEERIYLERFRNVCDDFPSGTILEREEPDFVVENENKTIGIEITKLYWRSKPGQSPRQAKESIHDRIAIKTQEIHKNSNLPPCHVSTHFSQIQLGKNDIERVASIVFNLVLSNLPHNNETCRIPKNSWTEHYLPPELLAISIFRLDSLEEPFYGSPQAGFIPYLDAIADVKRVLAKKNPKVPKYRRNCSEVWLIINIGFGNISSEFDVAESFDNHSHVSPFDRVYMFSQSAEKFWRLKLDD